MKKQKTCKVTRTCVHCQGHGAIAREVPLIACEVCGTAFAQLRKDKTTCSETCASTAAKRRHRARVRGEA